MAQIAFSGNIVAQAELKFSQAGKAVAKARIAENHSQLNRDTQQFEETGTSWRNIVAFGKRAEKLAEVQKGQRLGIIGRESSRAYEKDGEQRQWTEVAVDAFGIVPKGQQGQSQPPRHANAQGEGWGAQNAQQYGSGTGGGGQWPTAAQPGSGYQPAPQQQGFDGPAPF